MHCEKCGSADTEVIKCGDCGQKSCVKCSNCGFTCCTDKYCAAIAIKRKIKILKWAVVIIFLLMLGTAPFLYMTITAKKQPANGNTPVNTPTKKPTTTAVLPLPTKTVNPTKTANATSTPNPTKTTKPPVTRKPVPTKVATNNAKRPKGYFKNVKQFENGILGVLKSSKGIKFANKGKTRSGMGPTEYIQWAFKQIHWNVPASVKKLSVKGKKITNQKQLKPGDLVFFSLKKNNKPSYVGIYQGKAKFGCVIPQKGKGFTVGPLSFKFFKERYMYGRRIYPALMPK